MHDKKKQRYHPAQGMLKNIKANKKLTDDESRDDFLNKKHILNDTEHLLRQRENSEHLKRSIEQFKKKGTKDHS